MTKMYLAALNQLLPDADLILAQSQNLISCDTEEPQIIHRDVMTFLLCCSQWLIEGSQILRTAVKRPPRMITTHDLNRYMHI